MFEFWIMVCLLLVSRRVGVLFELILGRGRPGKIASGDGISRRQCGVLGVVFN